MNYVELLAPAGDLERLKFALNYGADAVYIGGEKYSLRANAKNFSLEEMKQAVIFAHEKKKKVYVTVNIVFHDDDLNGLENYLNSLNEIGIDAIIASDMAVVDLYNQNKYNFELHISTQASSLNHEVVKFYKDCGAKRVVLAREASREDIKRIKEYANIDLECFIHGAMCTSISGRCVLSNYATNRDSNRGGCSQICRWNFTIDDEEIPFCMTPKDLNLVEYIEDMINIGVDSFKVEGRMRSIYYISTIIYCYRQIIDMICHKTLTNEYINYYQQILRRCANRDSAPQFYNKFPGKDEQYYLDREEPSNQDFLGIVLDYNQDERLVTLEQRNYFKTGDIVEFFGPNTKVFSFKIKEIIDENGISIDIARHPKMIVKFHVENHLNKDDMMRIKFI